ncbi:MAG: hypothetical protein GWO79_00035 [Actinobacteria bacterium]|nr:hypothetical protein [Actinomycetota bacterium]
MCAPGECVFDYGACGVVSCVANNLTHHLNVRARIFAVIMNFQKIIVSAAYLILFFIGARYLKNKKLVIAGFYTKQRLFNSPGIKLFSYFIKAFSRGVLRPKIY